MKGNQHLTALGGRAGRKTQLIIGVAARFVQNCTLRDSVHRRTGPPFRREGGGELCQPCDRARRAMPRRAAFRDVVGCLVRTIYGDVALV